MMVGVKMRKIDIEKEKEITKYYQNNICTLKEIEKIFYININTVRNILRRNNIEIRNNKIPDDEINQMILAYNNGMNSREISKIFNRNRGNLLKLFHDKNVIMRPSIGAIKHKLNRNFFETIDTEAKAYWLGFITADGCICRKSLKIALNKKDEEHLKKFLIDLDSNYHIGDTKNNCKLLNITSIKMYKDLQNLGLTPNKSLTIKPCKMIPEYLLRHYWRGLIDGDGCIRCDYYNIKRRVASINLVGSFWIVDGFIQYLSSKIKSKSKIKQINKIFCILYDGIYLTKQIVEILYKDANIFLDRKKKLADEILSIEPILGKRDNITKDIIIDAYNELKSWTKTAKFLNCPLSTLFFLRTKYNLIIK